MNKEYNLEEAVNRMLELGKQAQDNMNHVAKAFEELVSMFEQDKGEDSKELKLDALVITPNYHSLDRTSGSWKASKEQDMPFYFQTTLGHDYGTLTLEEAEQLRDFLTDRINYLKS